MTKRLPQLDLLSDVILQIESEHWPTPGAKDDAIRRRAYCTPTRYYQLLNQLLDCEDALALYPVVVNRLRRVRDARENARRSA